MLASVCSSPGGTVARSSAAENRPPQVDIRRAPEPARLDRLIHERMRLAIVSALAVNESLTFVELKQLLGATDGNVSVHAAKLEEAGYVKSDKRFEGRIPRTTYRLTDEGREALNRYLD